MSINRQELRNVIARSAADVGCEPHEIQRLVDSADEIDHIAVGAFYAFLPQGQTCGCPATNAGYFIPTPEEDQEQDAFLDGDAGTWTNDATAAVRAFPTRYDADFLEEFGPINPLTVSLGVTGE